MTVIPVVVDATTRQFESWKGVAVIAETLGSSGWALAGGQMVALHLLMADQHGYRDCVAEEPADRLQGVQDLARMPATTASPFVPELLRDGHHIFVHFGERR